MKLYLYAAAIAALIGILSWAGWSLYSAGKDAGIAECQAERVEAAGKAQEAIDLRDQRSADSRIDMLDLLRVTIPPIEIKTHETVERIRTVYKDRPIPAVCSAAIARPDRVQADLNAARERANAAVGGVRHATPVASATGAGMARDRSVGSHHDGAVRDSSHAPERIERLPVWLEGIGRYPVAP